MPSRNKSRLGQALGTRETLVASSAAAVGAGTPYENSGFGDVTSIRAQLNVTAIAGTGASLSVVLEDTLDGGATWNAIGTFTAVTAAGRQVINVTNPFSDRVRVQTALTGTTPSATYAVDAYTE
jgi:hypothetical protein